MKATTFSRLLLAGVVMSSLGCGLTVGPEAGIESISTLVLGSPSIVLGDILRDSLGQPAPLQVNAYDGAGNLVPNTPVTFFSLDTGVAAIHIDPDGTVHGLMIDSIGSPIIGQVGALQTPLQIVFVSVHPDAVNAVGTVGPLAFSIATPDTLQSSNWSDTLALNVHNAAGVGAQGFVVRYDVLQSPAPLTPGTATVYIGNDVGQAAPRDTTDVHGEVHRRAVLNQFAIGDQGLLTGTKIDTIIVRATIRYAGMDVPGSPILYTIPVMRHP